MEGEERYKEARVQVRPELHFVPGLPQEHSIFHNMHYNHLPDSHRRKSLSLEDVPGLYNMSCTQLLALANDTAGTSSSSVGGSSLISQYSMDSWVNSWKMESNPCNLNSGSSLGIGIAGDTTTIEKPQYDDVSAPQKFICDLNLPPEEMMSSSSQPTEPEVSPITLETPGKRFHETDQEPHDTLKKQGKRAREDETASLKTPKQTLKKKKIRAKVVREGKINRSSSKSGVKKSSATASATKTSEAVRPRRSCRRSLRYDYDLQEEDDYCGIILASEELTDSTLRRIFGNIPKRRRTNGMMRKERICPSSEPGNDCLKSTLSLVNTGPTTFMEPEENLPRGSHISKCLGGINDHKKLRRKRSSTVTGSLNFHVPELKAIVTEMQSKVSRNKRITRDAVASQLNSRVLQLQWQHQNPTGASSAELWERRISIDALTKLFEEQDINKESHCLPQSRETALMLHKKAYQEQKALVPHKKDGSVLPYPNAKNIQSKVKVDDETKRVWKLLMASSHTEGIDGSDEEKKKWWQDERKMFQDRANSFIARMRLVQGNRKFSPWKGSVVDSVVGVFLTQCVTDHASSSVYMDLAAEFPINKGSCNEEWGSSLTQEVRYPDSIIIQEIDDDETDAVCSQETSKTSDVSTSSTNQLKLMLLDPPTNSFETQFGSEAREKVKCDEEESLVQPMCSHQQELKSTLQATYEVKKTRTKQPIKKKGKKPATSKRKPAKNKTKDSFDWDSLRIQTEVSGKKRERTERTMDTVDWDALRCTNVNKIANIIRKRGIQFMLSGRIKAFLNRLVKDHGSIDLEWLRDVPPDLAKEYLLSINGLGLKSVECVRLLSLHQVAFPVDTNVGRIAVRLGWVPIQPLPDELQMHLLELYPVLNSVQEYIWPRLCKLDQKTLYELHYHMITFGKVFCTKDKPNCNACPMKAECRHYSSSRASARLALPEPEEGEKTSVVIHERRHKHAVVKFRESLFLYREEQRSQNCEPIIEEPASPEPEYIEHDIEDYPWDNYSGTSKDPWENKDVIPTFMLTKEAGMSKDLVVVSSQEASIRRPKLKNTEKLRTEHLVYELPDDHPILLGFERRETEDSVPYLLAIWTPGETINSIQPPEKRCGSQDINTLCHDKKCFQCNCIREEKSQTVRGTILIPCRTAMRGGFPLNGTYFQTNEVFADHASSINPIQVPTDLIRKLPMSIAYFGSSVSVICRGLSVDAIQFNFWEGYVCVRGFDRKKRTSETLVKRLHCPPDKRKKEDDE